MRWLMVQDIFADTPASHAWFEAVGKVTDEDRNRIRIPDEPIWRQWLEYVEIPMEDIDDVVATTPSPDHEPRLYDLLQRGAATIIAAMGQIESPSRFAALADINHPKYRYFYVQLLASCLPFVQEYHRSLGISEQISQATLADLGRNVRVHHKREGVGGLGVMWWLMLHFRGVIYQLGRLQFEIQHASQAVLASLSEHGVETNEPTNVLSIHIPDFMGPMDVDACSDSIERATLFFARHFPDWPVEIGICNSWLLDPDLKSILKPTSNIIRFQERFTLSNESHVASDSVMQFVFGKHVGDIDDISPQSSLERGVIAHIKNGEDWHGREGWLRLPSRTISTSPK